MHVIDTKIVTKRYISHPILIFVKFVTQRSRARCHRKNPDQLALRHGPCSYLFCILNNKIKIIWHKNVCKLRFVNQTSSFCQRKRKHDDGWQNKMQKKKCKKKKCKINLFYYFAFYFFILYFNNFIFYFVFYFIFYFIFCRTMMGDLDLVRVLVLLLRRRKTLSIQTRYCFI